MENTNATTNYNGYKIRRDHNGCRIGTMLFKSMRKAKDFADRMASLGEDADAVQSRLTARD